MFPDFFKSPLFEELRRTQEWVKATVETPVRLAISWVHKHRSQAFQELALLWHKSIQSLLADLSETVEKFKTSAALYATIMVEFEWPPDPNIFPEDALGIVQRYLTQDRDAVEQYIEKTMLEHYTDEALANRLREWEAKEWFRHRIPLLRQAVEAHSEGRYVLSIPVLLAQTEGLIADGYGHKGVLGYKPRHGSSKKDPPTIAEYFDQHLREEGLFSFDEQVKQFFLEVVLSRFEHGAVPSYQLSRHAIMHGGDVNYGTVANSLRCILLFDYLQDRFHFVGLHAGRVYHRMMCPVVLARRGSKRVQFSSRADAENAGRRPCKRCIEDQYNSPL